MDRRAFSLLELLVVLGVLAVVATIGALNLRPLYDPLGDSLARTEGYLKKVRAKAMATTSGYRIDLQGNRLQAGYAQRCDGSLPFTPDPALVLEYPSGITVALIPQGASPCFTSRGTLVLLNAGGSGTGNPTITLRDSRNRTASVELLLGGGVVRR